MSKKNVNEEVIDEVMEGEVIEETNDINAEIERLEALLAQQKATKQKVNNKKRNILIGAGAGIVALLGGMYLMGKKAEKDRQAEEAANSNANNSLVLYDATGVNTMNNGLFTTDNSTTI